MATVNQDASIHRGASYVLVVPLVDEDDAPFDPTGIDLFYRVAKRPSTNALVSLARPAITNEEDEVSIPLPTATTDDLSASDPSTRYYHELFMIVSGERHVLMTGTLTVLPSQAGNYTPPEP